MLADAVESVMAQRMSADQYEVLIVDSASDDGTAQLLCSLSAMWGNRVRWVREDAPGLSRARNRGLMEAEGAITAFLDADAVAEPDWLASIVDAFSSDASCGAVGGPVDVQWDHARPTWWRDELDEALNRYQPGAQAMQLRYPKYPYGTNLAVRTEAAAALGGFSCGLGRRGRSLLAGEDGEMCLRLEGAGWQVRFEPAARVRHRTKASRLSKGYILKRAFRHGRSQRAIELQHGFESGLYPSTWKLVGVLFAQAMQWRCNLPFLKFWLFRAGYRWEGLRHTRAGGSPVPRRGRSDVVPGARLPAHDGAAAMQRRGVMP